MSNIYEQSYNNEVTLSNIIMLHYITFEIWRPARTAGIPGSQHRKKRKN